MYADSIQLYANSIQNMSLKFTKNQNLILEIFFNHPEKSYYLRELARIIDKKPGVFQKDINNLVNEKILESEYKANSRFFKLNQAHPLYQELKIIFFKTYGAEGGLRKILESIPKIKFAFIFGSYAKNKNDSYSDIDLMIIGNPNENLLLPKIKQLENKLDREINYHIFSIVDWQKSLTKKDSFFESTNLGTKIFLIGGEDEFSRLGE